jgi:hypothetical protein
MDPTRGKKLDLRGVRPPPRYCLKKTFSHRSRKSPNPCPTHTQRHQQEIGEERERRDKEQFNVKNN